MSMSGSNFLFPRVLIIDFKLNFKHKAVECRYLALVAALATEADFVFIPEWPPERGWDTKMCKKLLQARNSFSYF